VFCSDIMSRLKYWREGDGRAKEGGQCGCKCWFLDCFDTPLRSLVQPCFTPSASLLGDVDRCTKPSGQASRQTLLRGNAVRHILLLAHLFASSNFWGLCMDLRETLRVRMLKEQDPLSYCIPRYICWQAGD
jgi:hypothetical protein